MPEHLRDDLRVKALVGVTEVRFMLRDTIGASGLRQLLLRAGCGPEVRTTPRRSAAKVLAE